MSELAIVLTNCRFKQVQDMEEKLARMSHVLSDSTVILERVIASSDAASANEDLRHLLQSLKEFDPENKDLNFSKIDEFSTEFPEAEDVGEVGDSHVRYDLGKEGGLGNPAWENRTELHSTDFTRAEDMVQNVVSNGNVGAEVPHGIFTWPIGTDQFSIGLTEAGARVESGVGNQEKSLATEKTQSGSKLGTGSDVARVRTLADFKRRFELLSAEKCRAFQR